jgi:DNA-binding CsgD family transcriptional regulator
MNSHDETKLKSPYYGLSIDDMILRIKECEGESEVAALLDAMAQRFGLESYVFISLCLEEGSRRENHRYLIGCTPKWCQIYNANNWFFIDPFIEYALHHSMPILGSAIQPKTPGQAELLAAAAENGFRSGVVIPAHSGSGKRSGVLYLGSDKLPPEIEPQLLNVRTQLRATAMELFEWWEARMAIEAIAKFQLDPTDVALLKLEHQGFSTDEVGRILGISKSTINMRFRQLNVKFDVHQKKHAAERASQLGILSAR